MSLSAVALVDLTQAKNFLHVDANSSLRVDAEYLGLGDGSDKTFDLDYAPTEGSLRLYVSGVLKAQPTDYSVSGVTVAFVVAPVLNAPITASYNRAATADTFESFDDLLLERMIEAATKRAEDYTGRAFVTRSITENRMGDGTEVLRLFRRPITTISEVILDGVVLSVTDDYIDWSHIARLNRTQGWTEDRLVVVKYSAGYGATRAEAQAAVPDATLAVLLILSDLYENRSDKVDSINIIGIGSVSYKMPSRAAELLDPLRNPLC